MDSRLPRIERRRYVDLVADSRLYVTAGATARCWRTDGPFAETKEQLGGGATVVEFRPRRTIISRTDVEFP